MKLEEIDPHFLVKLLKSYSSLTALELPAIAVAIMALIPGFLDELSVGIFALVFAGGLKLARHYFIRNKETILLLLNSSFSKGKLSRQEYDDATRLLNSLTISGGR